MNIEQFKEIQNALGYSNASMGDAIGMSEKTVISVKGGYRTISARVVSGVKSALDNKIVELKAIRRKLK